MAKLFNRTQNTILLSDLKIANDFLSRAKGLLGTKNLSIDSGLWIHACNSIHTFGMKYAIDCIFLDKKMRVKKIKKHVVPYRLVLPIWGADSVVELSSGKTNGMNINLGDELYVGH